VVTLSFEGRRGELRYFSDIAKMAALTSSFHFHNIEAFDMSKKRKRYKIEFPSQIKCTSLGKVDL